MYESKLAEPHQPQSQTSAADGALHVAPGQGGSYSILALIEPFFANKKLLIISVLVSMLLGWLTLLVWPRKYQSEARLLIKVGRESVSLDPTATTSETMMLQKTQEEEVNSALELMSSRFVFEQAADQLGTDPILNGYLPGGDDDATSFGQFKDQVRSAVSGGLYHVLLAAGLKDDLSDQELAVMKLQKSVDIYSPKKSTVVIVNSKSRSPEMAQAISKAIVDTYLKQHLRTGHTEGSQRFFETQASTAEQQLNKLLDHRTAMLQERDIESIESTRTTLLATLADLETTVRARLNALELQVAELGSKVTQKHPRFQELRRELNQTREAVDAMQLDLNQKDDAVIHRTALLLKTASKGGSVDTTALRLLDQKRRVQKELGGLMDFQLELDDVERSIQVAKDRLEKLRSKQEEARLIDELQLKRISNISVAQPPTFVERAASPRKKILGAGFTALGFLVGLGLIVMKGMNSKEIRSIHQLDDLREDFYVVDVPSRPDVFQRFNSTKRGRWKKPVMQNRLEPVLQEIISMSRGSREGIVVGVTGLDKKVGATTVAAALAVHADAEGVDSLLVTSKPAESPRGETNGSFANPNHCISERVTYLNNGSLKHLNPSEHVSYNALEYRDELSRWMRAENELSIVDLPRQATRNNSVSVEMVDCVVVVAEAKKSASDDLGRCLRRLGARGVPVAAVVLNKSHRSIPNWIERLVS